MKFNETILPPHRLVKPFSALGCTELEFNSLSYYTKLKKENRSPDLEAHNLTIGNDTGSVVTLGKRFRDETYLITESSIKNWEGLVVQSRVGPNPNNVIRYLHGRVALKKYEKSNLQTNLIALGYEYPKDSDATINLILTVLRSLMVPVGDTFKNNCLDFSEWIKNNHSEFYNIPWPTDLDRLHD